MTPTLLRYAGLTTAPLAWALSTQIGQIMPYLDCRQGVSWSGIACALLLAASVAGAFLGHRNTGGLSRTSRFIVDLGLLVALASIFALILQGAATVLLDPCQH